MGLIDLDRLEILLPYQRSWLHDESPLKIWLAARQVGKSFAVSMEAVKESIERKCSNLMLSSSERQSREVMKKVYMHLRYFDIRSRELVRAETTTQKEATLPNGSRIISLPANPDTVRGFTGNVFLDEFAFHTDSRAIWRAMYPTVARGYKARIISTPNGRQNMFHELWAGDRKFSKHITDIYSAVEEGLKVDTDALRQGIGDPESWAQEFECRFMDEATAYITYEMIEACEDVGATKDLFADLPYGKDFYLGVDIGRKKDLTVFWLLQKIGDVFWTRMVKELSKVPFRIQREFLYSVLDGGYFKSVSSDSRFSTGNIVRRCCLDSSGIGAQLAEEATERFGHRVEAVTFTQAVKEDLAITVKRTFEDRGIRIPPDRGIREDIHSIMKYTTVSGNARFDAFRTQGSHADRFWALSLALHASTRVPSPVLYEPVRQRDFIVGGCY
jgi:phage FluMu gp28-like protein